MGATRGGLIRVFVTVGTTIGALGTAAGLVLGFVFLYFRQDVVDLIQFVTGQNLWDHSLRYLTELPAKTNPVAVIGLALMALLFSFLATLYPASHAASPNPRGRAWVRVPLCPAGRGRSDPVRDEAEPLGSLDPVSDRASRENQPGRGDRHRADGAPFLVPRHALPGVQGGEHRSRPGIAL